MTSIEHSRGELDEKYNRLMMITVETTETQNLLKSLKEIDKVAPEQIQALAKGDIEKQKLVEEFESKLHSQNAAKVEKLQKHLEDLASEKQELEKQLGINNSK